MRSNIKNFNNNNKKMILGCIFVWEMGIDMLNGLILGFIMSFY